MQPNNQQGNLPPEQPQPLQPQQPPQPIPPVAQPPQSPPQYGQQTVTQQTQLPQPQQAPTLQPVEALGSVAVADQITDGYGFEAGQDGGEYDDGDEIDLSEPVTWQAQEYIHQEKGTKWFMLAGVILLVFLAVAIFLMQSWSFAILLVVIAGVIVVLSKRPPRVMEYALSEEGLHIDNTLHKYDDFKSFGVIRDGEEFSVMLIPRRRFLPGITVYFPEEAGEDIVDALGSRLPMRDLHLDVVDRVVRKLRL